MASDRSSGDTYHCPDCGAELEVLYERNSFRRLPPMVSGWCSESGEPKSVPKADREVGAATERDEDDEPVTDGGRNIDPGEAMFPDLSANPSDGLPSRPDGPKWQREGGEGLPPDANIRQKLESDDDLVVHLFTCVSCGRRLASPPGPPADGVCGNCGGAYVCHTFEPAAYQRLRWYGDPRPRDGDQDA